MTPLEDHQDDTMTDPLDAAIEGTLWDFHSEKINEDQAVRDIREAVAKLDPSRQIAFEGALLIEWVRQVVGGLSDPTRAELDDLFDQCSDYSDKWNSGNTEPLPDPRGPSWEQVRDAMVGHDEWDFGKPGRTPPSCACGHKLITTRGGSMRADHLDHRVQAVLAIMPKPTDTEETNR